MRYVKNRAKSLSRVSVEQLNAENIFFGYGNVLLPDGEPIHTRATDNAFSSMCNFPEKGIKFPKWSCGLNCCCEFPVVFYLMKKSMTRMM